MNTKDEPLYCPICGSISLTEKPGVGYGCTRGHYFDSPSKIDPFPPTEWSCPVCQSKRVRFYEPSNLTLPWRCEAGHRFKRPIGLLEGVTPAAPAAPLKNASQPSDSPSIPVLERETGPANPFAVAEEILSECRQQKLDLEPDQFSDIRTDRDKKYGPIKENHNNIGLAWTGLLQSYMGIILPKPISGHLVALMMSSLKHVRAAFANVEDSYVDAGHYTQIAQELDDRERKG